jgi:hypothetical protein
MRNLSCDFIRRLFRINKVPERSTLPFPVLVVGEREQVVFLLLVFNLAAIDLNDCASDFDGQREFMTVHDNQIALPCMNLQGRRLSLLR